MTTQFRNSHQNNTRRKHFDDEMRSVLAKRNVPASVIKNITEQSTNQKTEHVTSGTKPSKGIKKILMNDKELLETEMYYFDFVIFGYDFPKIPT
jgi:hypothetical protein